MSLLVASGPVTFDTPGSKTISIGFAVKDLDFYAAGSSSRGHSDNSGYQFSSTPGTADHNDRIAIYQGVIKKVEFIVTGYTSSGFTCNVLMANVSVPITLVARG